VPNQDPARFLRIRIRADHSAQPENGFVPITPHSPKRIRADHSAQPENGFVPITPHSPKTD